jgi:hypothetical protein
LLSDEKILMDTITKADLTRLINKNITSDLSEIKVGNGNQTIFTIKLNQGRADLANPRIE